MNSEGKGYASAVENDQYQKKREKIYLKPMAPYVPQHTAETVNSLLDDPPAGNKEEERILTVINNNDDVSVDRISSLLATLRDPLTAADMVKNLISIVHGYESGEETNVCGR